MAKQSSENHVLVVSWLRFQARPGSDPTQFPIQWVPQSLSPGVKRSGREADCKPPYNAAVKNVWIGISSPLCAFMACRRISSHLTSILRLQFDKCNFTDSFFGCEVAFF